MTQALINLSILVLRCIDIILGTKTVFEAEIQVFNKLKEECNKLTQQLEDSQ